LAQRIGQDLIPTEECVQRPWDYSLQMIHKASLWARQWKLTKFSSANLVDLQPT